jgi:PAS domain S-box-containing protein
MPFNVGKVGQVAASRRPILVEDVAAQNDWIVRPEWAKREEIHSFAGHPLIFRDKLLGVIAVFSRHTLGQQEFNWLGLFANQAALAISNARAEQALQSSERNLGAIIDTIPTLAWCNMPDGSNEFLNRGWHEYTGLSPEESHGWGWQAAFHPEDLPPLMEKWGKMLVSGESDEIEARLRRHDGVYRWFLIRAQALRNDAGKIVRWYGTSTDIEDRKQAEEARRASERNLAAIINTIPTTAWTARADGYCDFLNQVWLDYAGMSAEQAQGWGWAEAIHPDDREQLVEVWQSSLASGIPVDTEARIRRFDSSYRWFLIRGNPLRDESGNILKWYGTCTDIEDRKRWEQILRERELSWRQIVDNIPGLVATTGALGEVEFLNRQTLEYFGKTSEELKDWALIDAVHPDDLPRVIETRQRSIEAGHIYDVEHRCRRADGVYRWFQVRGLPVRDAENKVTAWYLLLTDIDDRKKAEEALQSSERNLSVMIDAIPGMIHTARPDGYLDYFNRPWLEYMGCSLSDIEGWNWTARIHPDDLEGILEKWRACIASGKGFEYETRVRRGDGQYRWMFHRKVPLRDDHGNIVRWYGTSLDIEDRKRAEAQIEQAYLRLAEAQRLSKTGSFITDLMTDRHDWSEETFRIFEFDPASRVTVKMIRDVIHPEDIASFDAMIARAMTGADVDFVFRILTCRGAVKHIRGMARIMVQNADQPLFIGALQDITDSKVAEEALNKARSELADVARITTLNALTASVAHEINQPLASLVTNASICLRRLNADPPNVDGARETVQRTLRDANRASDVITRLRVLYSKKELTLEALDLNEATREVIALFSDDLQRKRVLLLTEFGADLPAVKGDRVQLQQVILNLLRNASDAMSTIDDRPRELLVRTEREDVDRARLSVKDTGVGLEPQAAERLFQPFYTTKSGGMGIGLSISRSIIEAHHGRLWAAPNAGPGATFSFSIPRIEAHPAKPSFAVGFLSNGDELTWMPEVVKILRDKFPNVEVTTSSQYSPLLAEALSNGQIDAALLRREEGRPDLAYETLLNLPLVVYMPKHHRLAAFQEIDPQDLVGETFITAANTGPVLRRTIDDYLKRSGVNITATHEVDHPGKALSLVSSGGVMILPAYLQNFLPDFVAKRPLKGDPPTIDLVLGYKKSNQSPILKFLISRLDDLVAHVTKREALKPSDSPDKGTERLGNRLASDKGAA